MFRLYSDSVDFATEINVHFSVMKNQGNEGGTILSCNPAQI